jgi:hypothetical protein
LQSDGLLVVSAEVPDAPISITEIAAQTTAYQIGLSWSDGVLDGGSPVIDYRLFSAVEKLTENGPT